MGDNSQVTGIYTIPPRNLVRVTVAGVFFLLTLYEVSHEEYGPSPHQPEIDYSHMTPPSNCTNITLKLEPLGDAS